MFEVLGVRDEGALHRRVLAQRFFPGVGVGGVAVEDLVEEVAAVGEQGPAAVGVHGEGFQDVLRDPVGECGGEGASKA